jgi:hypothetical protein
MSKANEFYTKYRTSIILLAVAVAVVAVVYFGLIRKGAEKTEQAAPVYITAKQADSIVAAAVAKAKDEIKKELKNELITELAPSADLSTGVISEENPEEPAVAQTEEKATPPADADKPALKPKRKKDTIF